MPTDETQDTAELPKDLTDAIALVKQHAKEHGDTIADELKGTPIYQIASRSGYSAAVAKYTDPDKGELSKAKARIGELEAELQKATEGKPDLDKVKAGYLRQISERDAEIAKRDATLASIETESIRDKFAAEVGGKLRGSRAKLAAMEWGGRIKRRDGKYVLVDADDPNVEIAIPKGKTAFQFAAEQAVKESEPEDVLSGASGGGGRTGNGSHGGTKPLDVEEIGKQKIAAGVGPSI